VRFLLIIFSLSILAGCASQPAAGVKAPPLRPLMAASPVKFSETRYDVRSYRDAAMPTLRHEAHVIYRRTLVPVTVSNELETVPRTSFPPASLMPLPASDELSAELATQRKITAELRAIQTAVADAGQKMQAQYALLVRQSAEAITLREQLEMERHRVRSSSAGESTPAFAQPATSANETSSVKW